MKIWKLTVAAVLSVFCCCTCGSQSGGTDTPSQDITYEVHSDAGEIQRTNEDAEAETAVPDITPEDATDDHGEETPDICQPNCHGKTCGDGGCGVSCGQCSAAEECIEGTCVVPPCQPKCDGLDCGDDGCEGSCGACGPEEECSGDLCVPVCVPDCTDKECGDDGCGGDCGQCKSKGNVCVSFTCISDACVGNCGGAGLGNCFCDDACAGMGDCCDDLCIACPELLNCCTPACEGKECGDNGCNGTCGTCGKGTICKDGICIECTPDCEGKECGDNGCNAPCGTCGPGFKCDQEGTCKVCNPSCDPEVPCVSDGCDGYCPCPVACSALPEGPFQPYLVPGAIASEGIAFDNKGNVVGGNIQHIFKAKYQGEAQVFVPGLKQRAGITYITTGDLIVNDDFTGTVYRVTPNGAKTPIVTGLVYPNGATADMDGFAYISDETQSLVLKVNPYGFNDYEVLSQGTILHPNGLTFDPSYTRLYVAGWQGDGFVWVIDKHPDGKFMAPKKWSMQLGNGLDGLEVDICGNLYVNDYSAGGMIRLPPDGQSFEIVVTDGFYIPNMAWGQGIGGWNPNHMFVPNGGTHEVMEIDVGVPGKQMPFP
jgi:hypothetical protein